MASTTVTTLPTPVVRRVLVEHVADEWLAMDEDGSVESHLTADSVLRSVEQADAGSGFAVTIIEWVNVPQNFIPPRVFR